MSFNLSNKGLPIALIDGAGKLDKSIIYLNDINDEDNEYIKTFNDLELEHGIFKMLPDTEKDRALAMTIIGPAGSGKSYYLSSLLDTYHKIFPRHQVYLLSEKDHDENLKQKYIKRIPIDEELLEDPVQFAELQDKAKQNGGMLIIFDDIDSISDKKLRANVYQMIDKVFKLGRSFHINIICTIHNYNGKESTTLLNECTSLTFFPQNWNRSLDYLTKQYCGFSNATIAKIRGNTKTRATTLMKTFPQVIIQSNKIFVVKN